MYTPTIRPVRIEDLPALAKTFVAVFGRDDLDDVRSMISREVCEGHHYLVAEDNGRLVGFVSWTPRGEPRHRFAELYHIGVEPGAAGTGARLIEALEAAIHAYFRSLGLPGARRIYLMTHADNRRARLFYHANGYRPLTMSCPQCGHEHPVVLREFFREGVDELVPTKDFPEHRIAAP